MNGDQFIRKARKWAKANGQDFRVDASRGKGGHQLLYVGAAMTTVKTSEIGTGLLRAMLKQLNIPHEEF
jgi:mRNA interferase HicA